MCPRLSRHLAAILACGFGAAPWLFLAGERAAADRGAFPADAIAVTRVPPSPDPIAEGWRQAQARAPRRGAERRGDGDEPPRPWERPNAAAATSLFERFPHNPVLALGKRGSLDSGHAEYPSVVAVGDLLWLFYSAFGAHHRWEIAAAVSADGIDWRKLGVVLAPDTTAGAWDSTTIAFPCVLLPPEAPSGERFQMWYAGKRGDRYEGIGFATSPDGRHWRRHGRVLEIGSPWEWDGGQIVDPCVVPVDGGYRLYYCGARADDSLFALGVALSADGRTWTKHAGNPVYAAAGDGIRGLYTAAAVPYEDRTILFAGAPAGGDEFEIHAVLSADGLAFPPAGRRTVLAPARDSTWDDAMVYGMDVMLHGDTFYMWFNGIYGRRAAQGGQVGLARAGAAPLLAALAEP